MKLNIHDSDFSEVKATKITRLKEHKARVERYKKNVKKIMGPSKKLTHK